MTAMEFRHRVTEAQRGEVEDILTENVLTEKIIGCAIEVHRHLGPGLLESTYEDCLCYELNQSGISFQRQLVIPVIYKTIRIESAYKIDLLIEDTVIIELKSVEKVLPVHHAQLLTYMKILNKPLGLLINFNVPTLKEGISRKKR